MNKIANYSQTNIILWYSPDDKVECLSGKVTEIKRTATGLTQKISAQRGEFKLSATVGTTQDIYVFDASVKPTQSTQIPQVDSVSTFLFETKPAILYKGNFVLVDYGDSKQLSQTILAWYGYEDKIVDKPYILADHVYGEFDAGYGRVVNLWVYVVILILLTFLITSLLLYLSKTTA